MFFKKLFGGKRESKTLVLEVATKRQLAEQVWQLELVSPEGEELPRFSAGSHIDVHLGNGIIRQYSLSNAPSETDRYVLAILRERESRGGSKMLCDETQPGDRLTVSHPKNLFELDESADEHVLVAAGIGITPILAMAHRLDHIDAKFRLHYRARSHAKAAYEDALRVASFSDRVEFYFTEGEDLAVFDMHKIVREMSASAHVYVCGPNGFIDHVLEVCAESLPDRQIHREFFHADNEAHQDGDVAFEVVLKDSGDRFTIPADKSVADVLIENGINVPVSCSEGICGSCISTYTDGEVDHRDMVLTERDHAKRKEFTPCCSRAKSAQLVIDL